MLPGKFVSDPSGDNGATAPIPVRERTCFCLPFEIVPPTADTSFVVSLHVDRRAGLAPTLTRGPAAVREFLGSRRDGQVLCGFDPSGDNGATAPIPVRERTCFSLRFEIVPPTADTSFVVSLHGLARDGRLVDPPQILFTKDRAWSFQCCF